MRKAVRVIRKEEAGMSALEFLVEKFSYLSKSEWEKLMEDKRITINGMTACPRDVLSPADRLETIFPNVAEPPVCKDYGILYEDAFLVAVDKPGSLPCHPGGIYFENTLWRLLHKRFGSSPLHFVHRLDRETSGIVLIARSPEAASRMQAEFTAGRVEKRYLALVEGEFPKQTVAACGCLARDRNSPVRKKLLFRPDNGEEGIQEDGKRCRTVFRGLVAGEEISLVEAWPETGRAHQIRASLLSMGHPVVGDKLYGPDDTIFLRFIRDRTTDADRAALRLARQALHSFQMVFEHPFKKRKIVLKSTFPQDWKKLCREKFGARRQIFSELDLPPATRRL